MSRPARRTASYGLTPSTGVVVDFWKNSGTISSTPPQITVSSVSTISRATLFSICSCLSIVISPKSGVMGSRSDHRHILSLAASHGLEHVVGHDQHTGQEQDTTQPTDRPERVRALDGFDEAVSQRTVGIDSAPHQALHHTGNPHRSDIQNGTDGGNPEVGRYQLGAVHLRLAEEFRQQVVDGTDGNHGHPATSAGVNVTNRP